MSLILEKKKKEVKAVEKKEKVFIEGKDIDRDKNILCKFCGRKFYGRVYKRCNCYRIIKCSLCGKLLNISDKLWEDYKSV
jgi:CRISPR/Cas system-associated protein Cas10 (large subunit of type III CRISPR-Cas system)